MSTLNFTEATAWAYPETRYAKVIENLAFTMNGQTESDKRDMARNKKLNVWENLVLIEVDQYPSHSVNMKMLNTF